MRFQLVGLAVVLVVASFVPLALLGSSGFTASANGNPSYQITFDQTGVGSDFLGTVVVVDGVSYTVGNLPVSFLWDYGSEHNFTYQSPLIVATNTKQYVWASTSGLSTLQSESITVSGSGNIIGNYKTQYYLGVSSAHDSPSPTSGWIDEGLNVTASVTSPDPGAAGVRYVCFGWSGTGSVPVSGEGTIASFTMTQASNITWNWIAQYLLAVATSPPGLAVIPGSGWYNMSASATLAAPSVAGFDFIFWDVDSVSQGNGVNPITVQMNAPHVATAHYAPKLQVLIQPLDSNIYLGQHVNFTSTVSGGTSPYSYQWYLDANPVSGAVQSTWTFTPSAIGVYYVYLRVTDANNITVQSATAKVTVASPPPVGGYSVSLMEHSSSGRISACIGLVTMFGFCLVLAKRRRM